MNLPDESCFEADVLLDDAGSAPGEQAGGEVLVLPDVGGDPVQVVLIRVRPVQRGAGTLAPQHYGLEAVAA